MATYEIVFDCPRDQALVDALIDAAAAAGAGRTPKYSRVACISHGQSTWRSEAGARPQIGAVGEVITIDATRISMRCDGDVLRAVVEALRAAHPYEEPFITVLRLDDATI